MSILESIFSYTFTSINLSEDDERMYVGMTKSGIGIDTNKEKTPEIYLKSVLVLGCGNVLFGDDGFGPAVAEHILKNFKIPPEVGVFNVGTSARKILFDIVLENKNTKKIIIVDAVDLGRQAGEIFELDIDSLPPKKIDDFSLHQLPTSNLLKELKQFCGVDVKLIACQIERIPEMVEPGLSKTLEAAVPKAAGFVMKLLKLIA